LPILLVGLNHTTAPVEVREKVSFTREQLAEAIPKLRAEAGEGVILSTCNRTEVYTIPDDPEEGSVRVAKFLAGSLNGTGGGVVHEAVLAPYLYNEHGLDAARHLFRVSSGLDSMILGESQILGQVRTAMTTAAAIEPLSADVSRLFHSAIRSGRRARDETDIGKNALTVSYTGVKLVQRTLGDLSGLSVLLVGAGEAGRLVADALVSSGVGRITVANRTAARANEMAVDLDAEAVSFKDIAGAIETSDVVITAVDHDEHVLSVQDVTAAMKSRERSLFILDLGVPRNIDPLAASLDGVILHNIDDLALVAQENLNGRQAAVVNAEQVVEDELGRFANWWDSREAASVIKDVREMAETTRMRELDKALKLMPGLTDEQQANIEAMSRSLVAKLLHQPTVRLKDPAGRPYLQAIKDLFGL
jgi:glutamyl-tRNA reductase